MGFKKNTTSIDRSDFTKLLHLSSFKFGHEMHQRIVQETELICDDKSQYDMADINRVLANYPKYFSWIIVEAEIINEAYERVEREYNEWYKVQYMQVADKLSGKPTINAIEAAVVEASRTQKNILHKQLNEEGLTEDEIEERLKYEGLGGRQRLVAEYKTKANIAKGMVKVWANAIQSLQSLSKNIVTEADIIRRQMGGL